ncbi:MAG: chemotaxis response regulator [Herbinix sp.]|nr:chemotaxis response regulator [Herbinix sp.]
MELKKKIKVLVVDDSILFREILVRGISSDPQIEVVATAGDPFEARDKIIQYEPDVMTCDVEMPKMNGIEFIRRLIPQYPLPIIVISSANNVVFDAMNAGAIDFVAKPDVKSVKWVEKFIYEIIDKIKIASSAKIYRKTDSNLLKTVDPVIKSEANKLIAIGASTGGTEAIHSILRYLPRTIPGIVVVQHIPPDFSRMFAERLNTTINLEVKEAKTGDFVENGKVLIAPGDRHMKIKKIGDRYRVDCFEGEKVNGHCPSVDVLFESVAKEAGSDAVGVILTGMGYDGAKGLQLMRRKGARTIGQDENTSVVYGMPKVAYNIGAVEKQVPLNQIATAIYTFIYE